MTERPAGVHLSSEELTDYFSSGVSLEGQAAVLQHLAECDSCTHLARKVYAATLLIDRWSAGSSRSNAAQRILYPALRKLIEKASDATLKERLKTWADTWSARADGAIRMVIESSSKAAQILTEGMEGLLRPHAQWQFVAEPVASAAVRGPKKSSRISVAIAPGHAQRARISVTSATGEVEVRIDNLASDQLAPLVVLVPVKGESEPQVKEIHRTDSESWGLAAFEGLKAGEYLVIIEPQ